MKKPIIAVDIDDVLAASAGEIVAYSNRKWGTKLSVDDYNEHWANMWQVDHEEGRKRAALFFSDRIMATYQPDEASLRVLRRLVQKYNLVTVTSRNVNIASITREWLEEHYKGVFKGVYFSGVYDDPSIEDAHLLTKAETLRKVQPNYLIDDQPKHCLAADEQGITAILFGDYPWNRIVKLPPTIIRCKDWQAVQEYFDGQR